MRKIILYLIVFTPIFGQIDYNSDIQPLLNSSCISCHGNSAGLNLSSYNNLMAGGDNGDIVIPFDYINSELWIRISSGQMPPGNNDFNSNEVDLIAQWISEGALEESVSVLGCTDPQAYNCYDDQNNWENYIFDVGGIFYDNSCNWDWNTSTSEPDYIGGCESNPCDGYYNPLATSDDGTCRYYQAPNGNEVIFNVEQNGINIDWTNFFPPNNGVVQSYHVQRCVNNCTWLEGFTPGDSNLEKYVFDEFDWEEEVNEGEVKYAIAVKYENNPYWGWAIGASYVTPSNSCNLGDLNGDGGYNVLDIVTLANCVLANNCVNLDYGCAGDMNGDGGYNVLDIVTLANCVLANNCG